MKRSLFLVAAALLLWGFGEAMFYSFVPIYLDVQFHLSEYQIGLVLGAFSFSSAITHIPAGRLSDRVGRRPLLISAWLLGLVSTAVMGSALMLPLFLVGLFGYGLTAFVSSPMSSYVTAARGDWSVGTVLALTTASFGLGMVLGSVTGGWIGDHYGMRMSFWVAAAVFVFSNLCIFFIGHQPLDHHDPESPPPGLLNNSRFVLLMGVLAFAIFAMYLSVPLTPNFLTGVRGLSLSQTGLIFSVGALGNSLITALFSRAEPRKGFLLAQALVILFALFLWKGTTMPFIALGYFLLGGFRAGRPMVMAQARELVHVSQMGVMYGVMETISAVIFIITPPLAGFLYERDPMLMYPLAIGLIVVSIVVSYIFMPQKEQVAVTS
ncbi:MAG: MFS transporter [Anaerolineales bacterium]